MNKIRVIQLLTELSRMAGNDLAIAETASQPYLDRQVVVLNADTFEKAARRTIEIAEGLIEELFGEGEKVD